ncbi:stathmin-3 [Denticeps clupeoides]|uniref:Stathmin n=1 Tax=Denticeps clupeoides TaxID=299321 RepID=A0AAY4EVB3_9TELE|nr:stathmin-3-like [Denticeps clupeoides]
MTSTISAYSDKIREMSVLSLICSCFHAQPPPNTIYQFEDLEVKSLNKRTSGQSFEVILKSPTDLSPDRPQSLALPQKKDVSLNDLTGRQVAAEQRRKTQEAQILKNLSEKREHEKEVLSKAHKGNNNFSKMAEEKLNHKMEVTKENRTAHLNALKQRLRQKEIHAAEVRLNKKLQEELSD